MVLIEPVENNYYADGNGTTLVSSLLSVSFMQLVLRLLSTEDGYKTARLAEALDLSVVLQVSRGCTRPIATCAAS